MKKIKIFAVAVIATMALANAGTVNAANSTMPAQATASSDNWDSILNQYEQYVNKYIAAIKKVQNGDATAAADLASLAAKAEKLAAQLQKAEDDMTEEQMARYAKITAKLASAVATM